MSDFPNNLNSGAFVTDEGIMDDGTLFEPIKMPSGQLRFMVIATFAAPYGETLRRRAEQIARSHWPEDNLESIHIPVNHRGESYDLVAYAPAQSPPDIFKMVDGKPVRIEDSKEIQPGDKIRVRVELRAYDGFRGQRGVRHHRLWDRLR